MIRTAIFIDGNNLHWTLKALGFDIDYARLRNTVVRDGDVLVRAHYYNVLKPSGEPNGEGYSSIVPLLDWLSYNGFSVTAKDAREFVDGDGRVRRKGNVNVEIACDALDLAPRIDRAIIISGDGDLEPAVVALQRRGVRVIVVSTIVGPEQRCADDLRRAADEFIDLEQIRGRIEKAPRPTRTVETVSAK